MKQAITTIIVQGVFYLLIYYRNIILKETPVFNGIFYGLLILGLSYFIFKAFYNKAHRVRTYFLNLFTLFVLFELMKYVSYKTGLSPRYMDVPIMSAIFSFIAIAIYLGILLLIAYLVRKFKKIK